MKITFLGTGTSQGVPVIACECNVCKSVDPRDKRLRTSVMIENEGHVFVIDTGPDFRQQMLRENVKKLDAVIFTHDHKDHLAGLDDIRAFNYKTKKALDVYASEQVEKSIRRDFHYIFSEQKYPGIPEINLHPIENNPFTIHESTFIPINVWHHMMPVKAFRINDFTYITDANRIEESELEKIRGSKVIAINALRREAHISHFTLHQAVELLTELKPERGILTHISHQLGRHAAVQNELPSFIDVGYDGMKVNL
jgi:phosphoribosyl 1,2-cyclic phosphate phosphodiesterase